MSNALDPVAAMLQSYRAAVLAKDLDAFAALYHPEVLVFDAWDQWHHRGLAEWRRMAAGWFGSLGSERVDIGFSDLQAHVGEDIAAAAALATYTALDPAGERLRSLTDRVSLVLRRGAEGWRIVHQHSSVPVGFDSRRPVPRGA